MFDTLKSNASLHSLFSAQDFSQIKNICVGVSGGGDSLALLFLLQEYFEQKALSVNLIALTVDHALREESSCEAAFVQNLCKNHGISHKILRWQGEKPKTALMKKARLERYRLLCEEVSSYPHALLAVAHTLEDQIETYIMRLRRGAGRGLAVMPPYSLLFEKVLLWRPVLACKREQLRGYLRQNQHNWLEDPSNNNSAYERVRIRQALAEIDKRSVQLAIEEAAQRRAAQSERLAYLIGYLKPHFDGACLSFVGAEEKQQGEDFWFLLGIFAAVCGGAQFLASEKQIQILKNFFQKTSMQPKPLKFSLCGAVIERSKKKWRIWRENRGLPSVQLAPKHSCLWDNRYKIINHSKNIYTICALPQEEVKQIATHMSKKNMRDFSKASASCRFIHYPSLLTSLAIRRGEEFFLPLQQEGARVKLQIEIHYSIEIFRQFLSVYDFVLYKALSKVFDPLYKGKVFFY